MANTTHNSMSRKASFQHISTVLMQAICANSNLETDWLWYAAQVTSDSERSYCLSRALQINPSNAVTQRDLAALRGEAPAAKSARSPFYQLSVFG